MKKRILLSMIFLVVTMVSANMCEDVYYFIIQNQNYSQQDLNNSGINESYIENYDELCYDLGYSDKLPKLEKKSLIINNEKKEECVIKKINSILNKSVSIPEIYLGDISCTSLNFLKYPFKLEKTNSYSITGLNYLIILLFAFSVTLILLSLRFYRKNKKYNIVIDNAISKVLNT